MIGLSRDEMAEAVDEIFSKNATLIEQLIKEKTEKADGGIETLTQVVVASFREIAPLVTLLLIEKNNEAIGRQIEAMIDERVSKAIKSN